jgi:hypothetical protein
MGIQFDSGYELKVYKELVKLTELYPSTRLDVHHVLPLKPASEKYNAIDYVVDFAVLIAGHNPVYIEAKGVITDEFILRMKMLDYFHPSIHNRMILASDSIESSSLAIPIVKRAFLLNKIISF